MNEQGHLPIGLALLHRMNLLSIDIEDCHSLPADYQSESVNWRIF